MADQTLQRHHPRELLPRLRAGLVALWVVDDFSTAARLARDLRATLRPDLHESVTPAGGRECYMNRAGGRLQFATPRTIEYVRGQYELVVDGTTRAWSKRLADEMRPYRGRVIGATGP